MSELVDPTIPHNESAHPLRHVMTNAIPTAQCMICHMHQPNLFMNTWLGYTMWDYETGAPQMWPKDAEAPLDRRAAQDPRPQSRGRRHTRQLGEL